MKREAFSRLPETIWPTVGLILFLVTFIGILVWVWRRSSKSHYQRMSKLPLDETKEPRGE